MNLLTLLVVVCFSLQQTEKNEVIIREKIFEKVPDSSILILATITVGYTLVTKETKKILTLPECKMKEQRRLLIQSVKLPINIGRI